MRRIVSWSWKWYENLTKIDETVSIHQSWAWEYIEKLCAFHGKPFQCFKITNISDFIGNLGGWLWNGFIFRIRLYVTPGNVCIQLRLYISLFAPVTLTLTRWPWHTMIRTLRNGCSCMHTKMKFLGQGFQKLRAQTAEQDIHTDTQAHRQVYATELTTTLPTAVFAGVTSSGVYRKKTAVCFALASYTEVPADASVEFFALWITTNRNFQLAPVAEGSGVLAYRCSDGRTPVTAVVSADWHTGRDVHRRSYWRHSLAAAAFTWSHVDTC